jgi:adenine-specific DNA-methyltransferase
MPTLQFKGKSIIWNHHLSIPYHTLDEVSKLHFQSEKANGNLIIEGDNLLALKALLPMYTGKIKCICIDPPYNTGNEGWAYNDNVNSPLVKEWLGKEVGKDDLTRHDKWLCMMTPRLRLLRDLLADDGVICINIDDVEVARLVSLMDEIFGEENKEEIICWRRRHNQPNDKSKAISKVAEFIVVYAKNLEYLKNKKAFHGLPLTGDFSNPDNDPKGDWASKPWKAGSNQTGTTYKIITPTGKVLEEEWLGTEETYKKYLKEGRMYFPKGGDGYPRKKYYKFEREEEGQCAHNFWGHEDFGSNQEASEEIKLLNIEFDNPKPVRLIRALLSIFSNKDSIILDSFSGSGTTGHAVMDLNKEDKGNRKFILVQMTEATEKEPDKNICKDITRERIKRAIEKYGYASGFKYLRVGQPLDAETLLEGKLPEYKVFAKYVYYLCTGENLKEEKKINEKKFFVGDFGKQAVYLIYKQDYEALMRMALNLEVAEKIITDQPDKKRIVYAPACFLDEEYMEAHQIEFVSIPYNLFQRRSG